jgi:Xaa-Pro aminopeptidase
MKGAIFSGRISSPKPFQSSEFANRRARLIESVKTGDKTPFLILQANGRTFSAPDVPHNFRQCSYFRYLCGCLEPNAYLVLNGNRSTLFAHQKTEHDVLWHGKGTSMEVLKKQAELDEVLPLSELTGFIASELSPDKSLGVNLHNIDNSDVRMLIEQFPGHRLNLKEVLDYCRWVKSEAELDHMKYVATIGSSAINSVIKQGSTISDENVIVGLLEYEMRRRGADSQAYPPGK